MAQGAQSRQRPRYWLITSPRTASNLLVKMLNLDEQGVRPARHGGYFFLPSVPKHFLIDEKPMDTWTEEENAYMNNTLEKCSERFQEHIAAAEQEGQVLYVKEHAIMLNHPQIENQQIHDSKDAQGEPTSLPIREIQQPSRSPLNLTLFPDEFLKTWNPTFLIRHPALMIPSLYRTCLSEMEMDGFKRTKKEPLATEVTMKWVRTLYDFYAQHFANDSIWPVVLDADDVMTCPPLVSRYVELAGLDASKVRYSWEKAGEQDLNKLSSVEQRMLSSINASTKIDHSKVAGNIEVDKEVVKWTSEFGLEGAQKLEKWVRGAMPDYEYMYSKRLRLEQEP